MSALCEAKEERSGLLLIDKPRGVSSFHLVHRVRRLMGVQKVGHSGTLDPFATGVMVLLVGREYTRLSNTFLNADKEYLAHLHLGISTDTYDSDGKVLSTSALIPPTSSVIEALALFQGEIQQLPPMYSAKKVAGKRLYELARQGIEIERKPQTIRVTTSLVSYTYPDLILHFHCSKGTYVRTLAHDLGLQLGSLAHLKELKRLRSGSFSLEECLPGHLLEEDSFNLLPYLRRNLDE